ncbi:MAG: GntR family transcriptional regulator [Burkholderiales bacterium]
MVKKIQLTLDQLLRRPQQSGVPKYVVLREALLELIKAGQWKPGAKFLSEEELLARTPYSLGTIQRAMRCLVDQRILIRRQGLGSFVADLPRRLDHSRHCKFVNDSGQDFLPLYSNATARVPVRETGVWSRFLGESTSGYIRIDRRISIDNDFLVASRFYCDPEVLPYLQYCPLHELSGANFVALIAKHCNIHVRSLGSYVTIKTFPKEIGREIKLKPGKPGLFVQATARTADDQYVYYQEFYVPRTNRALHFSEEVAFVPERHFDLT